MVEIHQNINRKDMIISKAFDFIIIMIQFFVCWFLSLLSLNTSLTLETIPALTKKKCFVLKYFSKTNLTCAHH